LAQALAPFGSASAAASAARISVVLRRIADPRAAVSHEFSTVASTLDHAGGADRTATTQTAPPEPVRQSPALQGTTLGHTSGQAIERAAGARRSPGQRLTTRQALRQRWGLAGAVAAIGVVGLLVVIVWRSGPVAEPSTSGAPVPAAGKVAPALTVEPIAPVAGESTAPAAGSNAPAAGEAVRPPDTAAGSAGVNLSAGSSTNPSAVASPPTAATTPSTAAPGASSAAATDRKKRVPARSAGSSTAGSAKSAGDKAGPATGAKPTGGRRGEPADPYAGSAAGSAAPPADDDDKWTHMTHDQGKR
jgi:hypothetical protein